MVQSPRTIDISVVRTTIRAEGRLTAEELAQLLSISPTTVQRLIRLGVIEPDPSVADQFPAATAARLDRMLRLRRELGVNFVGAAIITDLLERIERLEAEVRRVSPQTEPGEAP